MTVASSSYDPAGGSDRLTPLIWLAGLFLLALRPVDDYDTFWQLQSGRHIWEQRVFLYTDTFSLARDAFRLEHCWLSDIVFYLFYLLGGFILLGMLKSVIVSACGILLLRRNSSAGVPPGLAALLLIPCMVATSQAWVERPQLWTFLFSIVFMKLLHDGRENGVRSWGWLPFLMIVWANLHAGAVFGVVLIGFFWFGEAWRRLRGETSSVRLALLCAVGLLAFAATFLNPYGSRIPMQLLAHANQTNHSGPVSYIMEWLPPTTERTPLFYILFSLWGAAILARLRRIDPAELLFFCAFSYMGFNQVRHAVFVPLLAGFYLPASLYDIAQSLPRQPLRWQLRPVAGAMPVALTLTFLVALNAATGALGAGLKTSQFPVEAASFVRENRLPANLYNFYDWGGYLMWRLYPDYLVFVDGRNTSLEMLEASNRIDTASEGWAGVLDRYGVNTVITRTCYDDTGGPVQLVESIAVHPGWALVHADDTALVYLRRGDRTRELVARFERDRSEAYRTMLAEASRMYREDGGRSRALLAMARASMYLGDKKGALDNYRRFLERHPGDGEAVRMVRMLGGV